MGNASGKRVEMKVQAEAWGLRECSGLKVSVRCTGLGSGHIEVHPGGLARDLGVGYEGEGRGLGSVRGARGDTKGWLGGAEAIGSDSRQEPKDS